jgi:Mce-associated membrane protein
VIKLIRRRPDAATETSAADDSPVDGEGAETADVPGVAAPSTRSVDWRRVLVYGVLPGVVMILAVVAALFKWQYSSVHDSDVAAAESLQVAKDSTVALLSYQPDSVDRELAAARGRLTGSFLDSYTDFTNKVVIPGAKQKQITTTATIPAAVSVSADSNKAVALVFVSQTVTMGKDKPSESISSIRVSLDKVGDHWLISGFDPV